MFVLKKSCISSTREFIRIIFSINCEIARFGMGLACKFAIASGGRTTAAFDSRRVVDVVPDHCMVEDRVDRCFS